MPLHKKPHKHTESRGNYLDTNLGDERAPDLVGQDISMWRVNFRPEKPEDMQAVLGMWLFYAPKINPMLPYLTGVLTHLRPIAGARESVREIAKADYEFNIFMLCPNHPVPNLDRLERLSDDEPNVFLSSDTSEVLVQFQGGQGGDGQVYDVIDATLQELVTDEAVSLFADWRNAWSQSLIERLLMMINQPAPTVN